MITGRGERYGAAGARKRGPHRPRALALGLLAAMAGAADQPPPLQAADEARAVEAAADGAPATLVVVPADQTSAANIRQAAGNADLGAACDDAVFLLAAGRAREALGRLEPAVRQAAPDHTQLTRAHGLIAEARTAERREAGDAAVQARQDAVGQARSRVEDASVIASSLRDERLARVRDLRARGHRELALAYLRALLRDLPGDEEVDALFRELLDETHTARGAAIVERERELRSEIALQVERSLIPEGFDGRPMFPSDWSDRRAGRRSLLEVDEEVPAWRLAISDRLASRVTVGFDATPLAEAIDVVGKLGGINLVAAPELLAATDRLISLRATGMRLEDVLTWITEQAGTRWSLINGAIFLGDKVMGTPTIAIYDLGELLVGTSDFPGPHLDLTTSGSGGGPAGFLAPIDTGNPPATADDVADLIKRSVSPRSWDVDGNAIVVRNSALVVTAPPEVQRLIREFLRAQSAQHSLSVHIDVRWLQLYDRYVEEIGVQWSNGPAPMIATGNSGGAVRQLEGWFFAGTTTNPLPSTAMSVEPATAGTGLTLQSALLGSSRVSAVLQAVERNAQGRTLQSPELSCLNGQQANAFFGHQFAYISDYEIVNTTYDPVISVLNLGVMLEVRPLVSADRKFVTLELRTATSTATLFTETIVGVDVTNLVAAAFPIELPNVAIRTAGTTVMLPDRGSLLVGGFNASLDQFSVSRVPLLGSIPFLGRLFGARGRYSEKSKLYLLTTATIINYPELEARL